MLCSQRDFRINLFFPGEGGVVLLRLRSALELDLHLANFLHQDSSVDASMGADVPPEAGEDCRPEDRSDQDPEQHVDRHQVSSEQHRCSTWTVQNLNLLWLCCRLGAASERNGRSLLRKDPSRMPRLQ